MEENNEVVQWLRYRHTTFPYMSLHGPLLGWVVHYGTVTIDQLDRHWDLKGQAASFCLSSESARDFSMNRSLCTRHNLSVAGYKPARRRFTLLGFYTSVKIRVGVCIELANIGVIARETWERLFWLQQSIGASLIPSIILETHPTIIGERPMGNQIGACLSSQETRSSPEQRDSRSLGINRSQTTEKLKISNLYDAQEADSDWSGLLSRAVS